MSKPGGIGINEMHVDGGVAQTFLLPLPVHLIFRRQGNAPVRNRHAYVIRNARLDPEWSSVDRRLLSITGCATSAMIHYSGYNDIFRLCTSSRQDGIDFNLAYIGADFTVDRKENFDQAYIRTLFEYGYQRLPPVCSNVWTPPDKGTRAHVARSDKRQVGSTGVAVAGFVKDEASGP